MDLSPGGCGGGGGGSGVSDGSRTNLHDLEIHSLNVQYNNKKSVNSFGKNIKHDIRYKFNLKKHIHYKVSFYLIKRRI